MKILITAIGRRVELIEELKRHFFVIGTDLNSDIVAINYVDKFYNVPSYKDANYINILVEICKEEKVDMIIPLFESEFLTLCNHRGKFLDVGTTLLLSDKSVVSICNNKLKTYNFFKNNNIDTPITYSKDEIEDTIKNNKYIKYPLIIKPSEGMGSKNVFKINNEKELIFFKDYVEQPVIQEFIDGIEYTIDALCDTKGNIISIVPRERIEIRGGEVSKTRTVKSKKIIEKTIDLIFKMIKNCKENICFSVAGPLTIQCIVTPKDEIKFIEVNPRFGGGVPISFKAGIDYGYYFKKMILNEEASSIVGHFEEITMLRYDKSVYK